MASAFVPSAAAAQMRWGLGAGWAAMGDAPGEPANRLGNGLTIQGSIGGNLAVGSRWRFDVLGTLFDDEVQFYPPCPSSGCSGTTGTTRSSSVTAATLSGLVPVGPGRRGYLIGGVGVYDANVGDRELRFGFSLGAGLAIPTASRLQVVLEARWHSIVKASSGPGWFAPLTVGFRY